MSLLETITRDLATLGWEDSLKKIKEQKNATEDKSEKSNLTLLLAFLCLDRGMHTETTSLFQEISSIPAFSVWSILGQAFVYMQKRKYEEAEKLLKTVETKYDSPFHEMMKGMLNHCWGMVLYHKGDSLEKVLDYLHKALELYGMNHFMSGRLLDSLGITYASKGWFYIAKEFYKKSLELKAKYDDLVGSAITYGNLGRLCLELGQVQIAEEYFLKDLDLSVKSNDLLGQVKMNNWLAQCALATKEYKKALNYLNQATNLAEKEEWLVEKAFIKKDMAVAYIELNDFHQAEILAEESKKLFKKASFKEGKAHLASVLALICQHNGNYVEAEKLLRLALNYFNSTQEEFIALKIQMMLAQNLQLQADLSQDPRLPMEFNLEIKNVWLSALKKAEKCHQDKIVNDIEQELKRLDPSIYYSIIYSRVCKNIPRKFFQSFSKMSLQSASLISIKLFPNNDKVSSLETIATLQNHIVIQTESLIENRQGFILQAIAGNFLVVFLDEGHSQRALNTALDILSAIIKINLPYQILSLDIVWPYISISTGEIFLGNIGSYERTYPTIMGEAVDLVLELQKAKSNYICVSQQTYDLVKTDFKFSDASPLTITINNTQQPYWELICEICD